MIDTNTLIKDEDNVTNTSNVTSMSKDNIAKSSTSSKSITNFWNKLYNKLIYYNKNYTNRKISRAIATDQISLTNNKYNDSEIVVAKHQLTPKELTYFIASHEDLLADLPLQTNYTFIGIHGDLSNLSLTKAMSLCPAEDKVGLLTVKVLIDNFDYFLKLLLLKEDLLSLLNNKPNMLRNLVVLYAHKLNLIRDYNYAVSFVMKKFLPILLQSCYNQYDQFENEVTNMIDGLSFASGFRQASLFSFICANETKVYQSYGELAAIMPKADYEAGIANIKLYQPNKDLIDEYCIHFKELMLLMGRTTRYSMLNNQMIYKCSGKNDVFNTIFYLQCKPNSNIELDLLKKNIDCIRLNGYRKFIEELAQSSDSHLRKICHILLTAQN